MPITNFENITQQELTEYELSLIPILIKGFNLHNKENPIKEPEIVKCLREKGFKISGVRLRKCVNHIRSNSLIPLIATHLGYYTSNDQIEIENQIKSLRQRAYSINKCADGLIFFLNGTKP
jgi:hypothetical protein